MICCADLCLAIGGLLPVTDYVDAVGSVACGKVRIGEKMVEQLLR